MKQCSNDNCSSFKVNKKVKFNSLYRGFCSEKCKNMDLNQLSEIIRYNQEDLSGLQNSIQTKQTLYEEKATWPIDGVTIITSDSTIDNDNTDVDFVHDRFNDLD